MDVMKREYQVPEVTVLMFEQEDIITSSGLTGKAADMESIVDWETLLGLND